MRLARQPAALSRRERIKLETTRAAPLREIYPQVAELRIEFDFDDGTPRKPSAQVYSYFPAARGYFRYACPCHACTGEFDLSPHVVELAASEGRSRRSRSFTLVCTGQREPDTSESPACPICAQVRVTAVLHNTEQST